MKKLFLIFTISLFSSCTKNKTSTSNTEIITTIAGNGVASYSGDGGAAISAELNQPIGVAVDDSGNIYIADWANNRVRKVNTSGIITTFMELTWPNSIACDDSGNVYVSNGTVFKINSIGTITTLTSAGVDAVDIAIDDSGNLYIADENNQLISKIDKSGRISTIAGNGIHGFSGDGGPAIAAELYQPSAIAVDGSGNVYIADQNNQRIRKVNTSGIISTIAGKGIQGYSGDGGPATDAEFYDPAGLAVDGIGNVYIADLYNHRIRKVDALTGNISTIAGNGTAGYSGDGGAAVSAELSTPSGIAIDVSGNVYIADDNDNRVRKVSK